MRLETNRNVYVYRCDKCNAERVYVVRMPEHLQKHMPLGRKCDGNLVFIEERDANDERRDNAK